MLWLVIFVPAGAKVRPRTQLSRRGARQNVGVTSLSHLSYDHPSTLGHTRLSVTYVITATRSFASVNLSETSLLEALLVATPTPMSAPTNSHSMRYGETTPLLREDSDAAHADRSVSSDASNTTLEAPDTVSTKTKAHLYVSNFLSTWNSRVSEFGAVLYLATIYPGTLLPLSIYALTRGLAAILFAPMVGQYIDRANRLTAVRLSIGKRCAVTRQPCK